jgi:hypothetical protein
MYTPGSAAPQAAIGYFSNQSVDNLAKFSKVNNSVQVKQISMPHGRDAEVVGLTLAAATC